MNLATVIAQVIVSAISAYEQVKGKPFDIDECRADAKASSDLTTSDNAAVDSEIDQKFKQS